MHLYSEEYFASPTERDKEMARHIAECVQITVKDVLGLMLKDHRLDQNSEAMAILDVYLRLAVLHGIDLHRECERINQPVSSCNPVADA